MKRCRFKGVCGLRDKNGGCAYKEVAVEACDKAGIPVFIKHNMNSENLPNNAFNKDGLVRQEMPNG